jgi:hypothetical protein
MHVDEKNIIIDNFFTDSEIEQIYDHVKNTPEDKKILVDVFGHVAYFSGLPNEIVEKIEKVSQKNYNKKIKLEAFCYARYSIDYGIKPKLFPHYDDTFKEPRFTVDIQLKATKAWPIVVEGRPYTLKNNQALTFSGTHQIHWREKIAFDKNDYVDMIFCHFVEDSDNQINLGKEHADAMNEKEKRWNVVYDLLPDPYVV